MGVDYDYVPVLKAGAQFTSATGASFLLMQDVDFSLSSNEIVAARKDQTTGLPTHYAIKAYGKIISGEIMRKTVTVGDFQRFLKIKVGGLEEVSEILRVTDDEGHEYHQVEYLSQDVVYKEVVNKIYYLNLENETFNKMRINASNSIDKDFSKKNINLRLFNIIRNYEKKSQL